MKRLFAVICGIGLFAIACSGGAGGQKLKAGEVALPDLSKVRTCLGSETKPNSDQLQVAEILLARAGGQNEAKCLGIEGQGDTVQVHVVVNQFQGTSSQEMGDRAYLHKVSGEWQSEKYGFVLGATSNQVVVDTTGSQKTQVAYVNDLLTATAVVEQKTKTTEEQSLVGVAIKGAEIVKVAPGDGGDSDLPVLYLRLKVDGTFPPGDHNWGIVLVGFSDGTTAGYRTNACFFDGYDSPGPGSSQVDWKICTLDKSHGKLTSQQAVELGNGARIIQIQVVAGSGAKSQVFTP